MRRWFLVLGQDGRIVLSWFVLFGCALLEMFFVSGRFSASAVTGYLGWSYFWGVPGAWVFLQRVRWKLFSIGLSNWIAVPLFLVVAAVMLLHYPPLGGGVFHFLRRWWAAVASLPHVPVAPFVTAPPPPSGPYPVDIEPRLLVLANLLARGAITQEEYDRQRRAILGSI